MASTSKVVGEGLREIYSDSSTEVLNSSYEEQHSMPVPPRNYFRIHDSDEDTETTDICNTSSSSAYSTDSSEPSFLFNHPTREGENTDDDNYVPPSDNERESTCEDSTQLSSDEEIHPGNLSDEEENLPLNDALLSATDPNQASIPMMNMVRDYELEEDILDGWTKEDFDTGPTFQEHDGLSMVFLDNPEAKEPHHFFEALFDDRMYTIIVEQTNLYARRKLLLGN